MYAEPYQEYRILWCLVQGDYRPFKVTPPLNIDIDDLKKVIHAQGVDTTKSPKDLVLWKLTEPEPFELKDTFARRVHTKFSNLSEVATEQLGPWEKLSALFPQQPPQGCLHIIIQRSLNTNSQKRSGSTTADSNDYSSKRPRSSDMVLGQDSFSPTGGVSHPTVPYTGSEDAGDDAGPWLTEVHSKIWNGGEERLETLVHKVEVTVAHYRELQRRLEARPNRDCDEDIPAIKREILLHYQPNHNTSGNAANVSEESRDDGPEPEPNFNTSGSEQVPTNVNEESGDDDPELGSFLPATFEFLDLSSLKLKHKISRLPLPLFIRPEYSIIYEEIRRQVNSNSHMVGGQPGIGKTAFLHYMMIKYMIVGRPFLYQTIRGNVYHVSSDGVKIIKSWVPRINIVAFVDAMNSGNFPKSFLRLPCVQFVLASSPKSTNTKWIEQLGNTMFGRIVDLWSPREFYITGIFLHPHHFDFAQLRESTSYFNFNPRRSFIACKSGLDHQAHIIDAIKSINPRDVSLYDLMNGATTGTLNSLSHVAFEILPLNEKRYFSQAQVRAVSPWVLEQLLEHYEQCDANASADFYNMPVVAFFAGPLRREMFQLRVLKYFDNINHPMAFKIRNLTTSESLDWTYPGPARRKTFQSQSLPTLFKEFVEKKEARHLVPLIPDFAIDSILYDPASVLTGFQITINQHQPVAVSAFQLIQQSLKHNNPELTDLQPETARCWRLIFVVPKSMAANFPLQRFEGDTDAGGWARKVDQYVLGLEEEEVWRN